MSTNASSVTHQLNLSNDIDQLKNSLDILENIYGKDQDIHIYTQQTGLIYKNFYNIDIKYHLSANTKSLDTVVQEILAKTPAEKIAQITTILTTIKGSSEIEPETGINVSEILIRTWDLANTEKKFSDPTELVIDNLQHNIEAQGGCLAGIVCRLILPYANFVYRGLIYSQTSPFYLNAYPRYKEEQELQMAIEESLKTASEANALEQEEENLQRALARSLSLDS
ncbi:MAG: hypothetical protein JWM09_1193 [Francisellaceae bacterium]|nr:hypothetical protein [Francisellaceae bacterium]